MTLKNFTIYILRIQKILVFLCFNILSLMEILIPYKAATAFLYVFLKFYLCLFKKIIFSISVQKKYALLVNLYLIFHDYIEVYKYKVTHTSHSHMPLVQVMIPESWDHAPHRAPHLVGNLLLPLPLPPTPWHSLSQIKKIFENF